MVNDLQMVNDLGDRKTAVITSCAILFNFIFFSFSIRSFKVHL